MKKRLVITPKQLNQILKINIFLFRGEGYSEKSKYKEATKDLKTSIVLDSNFKLAKKLLKELED